MPEAAGATANNLDLNVENLRKIRSEEQWLRYDTICIGKGAKQVNTNWFEDFATFAGASNLVWFTAGRTKTVGESFCNLSGQSEDFAQRIYQTGIEFIAPPGMLGYTENLADGGIMQTIFEEEFPNYMRFSTKVQNVDEVLQLPGIHQPAGVGVTGQSATGAGALFTVAGHTGDANLRNTWAWPHALGIPSKSKIEVNATVDDPLKTFLLSLPDTLPGTTNVPVTNADNEVATFALENWYRIRIWHRGPRYVQLRGARSAVG